VAVGRSTADGLAVTPSPASLVTLVACLTAAVAALVVVRRAVGEARGEQLFDGAMLGLGLATATAGFAVLPVLHAADLRLAAVGLLAVAAGALGLTLGTRAASVRPAALWLSVAVGALLAAAGLGLLGVALAAALRARPRALRSADPDDDGAEAPVRRHLLAPIAYLSVFPASLALLLAVRGPSTLAIAVWGATWSVAGALAFARQNWVVGDRHRAIARERDLRREMVRRNAELAALIDLADAVTRMRGERQLVERGLQVLLRVSDARSVHIELGGDRHCMPPEAVIPDGDPHAVGLPLVVRDEHLGSVLLVGREEPFPAETLRLVGVLGDQLAVGLSHIRDYTEKSHQALRDPLTGLYNRRVLGDALTRELLRARRDDGRLSLTMLDIDDFKAINDVHGHDAGDEVLRRVAACARDVVRPGDTLARIGGEEFALLTPGAGAGEARRVAERLRIAVATLDVLPDRGVTVSAGIAAWPDDARDADALHRAADEALYRAKAAGKNRCELAGEAPAPA
jgi:diguanylate cyclase (GGDEF)-like protein